MHATQLRHRTSTPPRLAGCQERPGAELPGGGAPTEPLAGPQAQARHTERHAALTPWPLLSCLSPSCLPGGARPLADYQRRGSDHWIAARIIGVRKQHFSETKKREVDPLNNDNVEKVP